MSDKKREPPELKEVKNRLQLNQAKFQDYFDATKADPDELERRWLPARPDPKRHPAVHKMWWGVFGQGRNFKRLDTDRLTMASFSERRTTPALGPIFQSRAESSRNWSGSYIVPFDARQFSMVMGAFRVPSVSLPANADPALTVFNSSTWVGFDGQRRYFHSSLPQIGTEQRLDRLSGGTTVTTRAWFQWWVRNEQFLPVYFPSSFQVEQHDEIFCHLSVVAPTRVRFFIANLTKGLFIWPFDLDAPSSVEVPAGPLVQLRVSGATAEWIMERPTDPVTRELYPLPDYGTAHFDFCAAFDGVEWRDLVASKLIDMYEIRANPHRSHYVSRARRIGDQSIETVFVD